MNKDKKQKKYDYEHTRKLSAKVYDAFFAKEATTGGERLGNKEKDYQTINI